MRDFMLRPDPIAVFAGTLKEKFGWQRLRVKNEPAAAFKANTRNRVKVTDYKEEALAIVKERGSTRCRSRPRSGLGSRLSSPKAKLHQQV